MTTLRPWILLQGHVTALATSQILLQDHVTALTTSWILLQDHVTALATSWTLRQGHVAALATSWILIQDHVAALACNVTDPATKPLATPSATFARAKSRNPCDAQCNVSQGETT